MHGLSICRPFSIYSRTMSTRMAPGYWQNIDNVQKFLCKLKLDLHLNTIDDWNAISTKNIRQFGGIRLLNSYSLYELKCLGCPEGKEEFKKPNNKKPAGYWKQEKNVKNFVNILKEKLNLITLDDWNNLTQKEILSNGGGSILQFYSINKLKSIGFPEGNDIFLSHDKNSYKSWKKEGNFQDFLLELKEKLNLQTFDDWNSLTTNQIKTIQGGSRLLKLYSLNELKSLGFPEGKFNKPREYKSKIYWTKKENIHHFVHKLKEKLKLKTFDDWNLLSKQQIIKNGGSGLLHQISLCEIKKLGFPEYNKPFSESRKYNSHGYWEDEENIQDFLSTLQEKLNLHTFEEWNKLTSKIIVENGGKTLLNKYSVYDLKCIGFPDGKLNFKKPKKVQKPIKIKGFWYNEENINCFVNQLKEKLNLNNFEDWNSITYDQIQEFGGSGLLRIYSLYNIKCLGFPEGKSNFTQPKEYKSKGFWKNKENIHNFIKELKEKLNLKTFDDWNSLNQHQVHNLGGGSLLSLYSLYDIKCLGFPDGKLKFTKRNPKNFGYWDKKENILNFLHKLSEEYNLDSPEKWNSITKKKIQDFGGCSLLVHYSVFELKCLGCPDGKNYFKQPNEYKSKNYWNVQENIHNFIEKLKTDLKLQTFNDWNSLTKKQIKDNGGNGLLSVCSLFEIKCLGFPNGKLDFKQKIENKSRTFWENEKNIHQFLLELKRKFNLNSIDDWKRISKFQIKQNGGRGLLVKYSINDLVNKFCKDSMYISANNKKRSSQRWLFLQIQKLFPGEELVEDYFHSEISRNTGFAVQFDIYLTGRKIAFEYHGQQHYEDIPQAFSSLEMYKNRDKEKEILCQAYGIKLIVIPYWWDNNENTLQQTINKKLS